jgi:predicted nuclease of predicted toxin-antitoxin system
MKILLDECVPIRLEKYLESHTVGTVTTEGWTSFKNGKLMKKAIDSGYEVLLTVDKNLEHQQNMNKFKITVVVFDVLFNRLQDFIPLIPKFLDQLPLMKRKMVYVIQ